MAKIKLPEVAKKLGKSATDIANDTGINRNTINSLMKGEVEDLKFSTLEKISKTYGVKVSELIDLDEVITDKKAIGKLYRQEGSLIPFTCWSWAVVVNDQAKEFFDFGFGKFKLHFKGSYGKGYWDHDSLYALSKWIYDKYKQPEKIDHLYTVFATKSKVMEEIYYDVRPEKLTKLSNDELVSYFDVLWSAYIKFWEYSVFIDSFDPGLDQEEIAKVSQKYSLSKDDVSVLTTPSRMTFNNERILSLLRIIEPLFVKKITGNKIDAFVHDFIESSQAIKEYIHEFGYYKSNYSFIRPITKEEVAEEIKKYLSDKAEFKKEFAALQNYTDIQEQAINKILKRIGVKENPLYFFNLLTFWREERKKVNLMGICILHMILTSMESRTGIPKHLLEYLSHEEVGNTLKGLVTKKVLEGRYKDGVIIDLFPGGYKIIEGKEAISIAEELERQIAGEGNRNSITGQTACQGYAKGIARIILEEKDFDRFNEGEVLVTGMTRPEFVPLMRKAVGIITNEGGITCHAAIVSRELGKPCIIGTKNATQLIKDGDLVEVRANHGTVRILN